MFFSGVGDAMLLKMRPSTWDKTVRWTTGHGEGYRGRQRLDHYLPDG